MNILIIYAHPSPESFSHSILIHTIETLRKMNHDVSVRDLYNLKFDPVLTPADFTRNRTGDNSRDIALEQELITHADLLIFIYPVWWGSMPAILKGYIDRVFLHGYAFVYNEQEKRGLLMGKKALVFNTHGTPKDEYDANGMIDAMRTVVEKGIFDFCGIQLLDHVFFGDVTMKEDGRWKQNLGEVEATLKGI